MPRFAKSVFIIVPAIFAAYFLINGVIYNNPIDGQPAIAAGDQQRPRVYLSGESNQYGWGGVVSLSAADEPSIIIDSYNISGTADVDIYQAKADDLLNFLTHDEKNNQIKKEIDLSSMKLLAAKKQEIGNLSPDQSNNSKLFMPSEASGILLVNLKIGSIDEKIFVVRSGIGIVVKESEKEFIFWAQNFKTKRSVGGGSVKLYNLLNGKKAISEAKFDNDGIAKAPLSSDADIAIFEKDGTVSLIPLNLNYINSEYNYRSFQNNTAKSKYFIFTDRPIYQPGDTVYFKSILRDDRDAVYSLPSGVAGVEAYKGWDKDKVTIFSKSYQISSSGAVSGEFKLPDDMSVGFYNLKIQRPQDQVNTEFPWMMGRMGMMGRDSYSIAGEISFDVEYYQKPEYSVEVSAPHSEYIAGDQLIFDVKGSYFSGQPAARQTVNYKVYSSPFYDYEYYQYAKEELSDEYRYYGWSSGKEVKSGQAELDANGRASIDIGKAETEGNKTQVYTIEAELNDESNLPSFDRKNILVHSGEFSILRSNFQYGFEIGEKTELEFMLLSHRAGNIADIPIDFKIHRNDWAWNSASKTYNSESEDLPDMKIATNSQGKAILEFLPEKRGYYEMTALSIDGEGNQIKNKFYLWAYDDGGYYSSADSKISVAADKKNYAPGETAELTITSTIPDRDVFLSLERGWLRRFEVVKMSGGAAKVKVPLAESDMPNIFAHVSGFSNSELEGGEADIEVSSAGKKIKATLQADKEKYGPGDTVSLNIHTTDNAGDPISAEAAVWAVDKALFELVSDNRQDVFNSFWSKRYNSTSSSHSLRQITSFNAEGGGCFAENTKILMSDGSRKNIEDVKIGDYILTRKNERDQKLVKAKVMGTHKAEVDGYLIFNGQLKITPNHILFANGDWQPAGDIQIGDTLADADGKIIAVDSIEWQQGKFSVYNLTIENQHSFFADNIWVHNNKDGGARTVFKDAAYWNPSIRTNSEGNAKVSFKLPDNLTTWVIQGIAATDDTKVGEAKIEIAVSKNVFIRPILPNILREGDKITISALAHNFTDMDRTFDASLSFDSGEVLNSKQQVIVKVGESAQIFWPVRPIQISESAKLSFSIKDKNDGKIVDAVVKEIPVRVFGFFETRAIPPEENNKNTYKISPAAGTDIAKSSIKISLASTLVGSLPAAAEYLIAYPYGCMEQTTSRFVPVVIAKENPEFFKEVLEDKNLDAMIKSGVKRLISHQKYNGSWGWWMGDQSDTAVSAYVLEYLLKAKQAGVDFNQEIIGRAQGFFEQSRPEGKIPGIYRKYALALLGSDVDKGQITEFGDLQSDALAIAVLANIKNGHTDPGTNGLKELINSGKEENNMMHWETGGAERFGSIDASTALALRALIAGKADRAIAEKAARFLVNNRVLNYWSNSYATAQIIQALVDFSKTGSEATPSYSYTVKLDGKIIKEGKFGKFNDSDSIIIPASDINKDGSGLELSQEGDGQLYATAIATEFLSDRNAPEKSQGLEIERSYANSKGINYSIGVGDIVNVRLKIKGSHKGANHLVIEDILPSGMVPINQKFKNEQYGQGSSDYYDGFYGGEITEEGMILPIDYVSGDSMTYGYKARVISEGIFDALPAKASYMYQPEINGRTKVDKVVIGAQSEKLYELNDVRPAAEAAAPKSKNTVGFLFIAAVIIAAVFSIIIIVRPNLKKTTNAKK